MTTPEPGSGADAREVLAAAIRRGDAALAGHLGDEKAARRAFRDRDPGVRAAALGALVRMGAAAAADGSAALEDAAAVVRVRACELSAALSSCAFAPLLEDREDLVVEAACFALGEVRAKSAVEALAQVAGSHENLLCRESAVAALGAIGDPGGLPAVLAALDDRPQVRRRAVVALAAFDGPEVDAALKACLGDRDWQVRQAAEDLLGVEPSSGEP